VRSTGEGAERAENRVLAKVSIELLLERLRHVDCGQHAEALPCERVGRPVNGLVDVDRNLDTQSVTGLFTVASNCERR
jgi:hypothetical protein